jgi:hypothetical protein
MIHVHVHRRNEFIPPTKREYLPIRLLDVEDSSRDNIRLVSTDGRKISAPVNYFALSHCWGDAVNKKLTKQNIGQMMNAIPIESLSQNFRDAIFITRKMGLKYLWIDSLCIVQDDEREWNIQSAVMGLVYSNAACVISATASKDSAGGYFLPRKLYHDDCLFRKAGSELLIVESGRKPDLTGLFQ